MHCSGAGLEIEIPCHLLLGTTMMTMAFEDEAVMSTRAHWDKIYSEKAPNAVSWYRIHLEASLGLIEQVSPALTSAIIDVGGGESTLVDDLLAHGYEDVTVLDISQTAIDANKSRLGELSRRVKWLVADITQTELGASAFDVWHDRAVFHFLTSPDDRAAYVRQVARAVRRSGYVIVSTFGPEGPTKCSGLDVVRYDAESLHREFGVHCIRLRSERRSSFSSATAESNSAKSH